MNSSVNIKIKKYSGDKSEIIADCIAVEEPLEISLVYGDKSNRISKTISVTMRTPCNDEELALGFLFTEGIIQNIDQIFEVTFKEENNIQISLQENVSPEIQKAERNFYSTSSCGVCGKSSIESIRTVSVFEKTKDDLSLSPEIFYNLNKALKNQQNIFQSTGGLHASALFDCDGKFMMLREDVGRHNALDKVIGYSFKNNLLPLSKKILLLSGRAGFELIQKALMAGIKVIAAFGAPSSLAIQLAEEAGITLIGFLKSDRLNIYSCEQRIKN